METDGSADPLQHVGIRRKNHLVEIGWLLYRSEQESRRADANYLERSGVYGRHRLYQAAVTLTRGNVDWGVEHDFALLALLDDVAIGMLARLDAAWSSRARLKVRSRVVTSPRVSTAASAREVPARE